MTKNPNIEAYCSGCGCKSTHALVKLRTVVRSYYCCSECNLYTLPCRAAKCGNMALVGSTNQPNIADSNSVSKRIWERIDNSYCSEHNHTIFDFEKSHAKVETLSDANDLLVFKQKNARLKTGKIIGGLTGLAVTALLALLGAPAFASFLGTKGLLGAASTGTPIVTLYGAALTNASLAALGGGIKGVGFGMAGGTAFITATGMALGGIQGAMLSASYFSKVKDFKFHKLIKGNDHEAVFINGFLSQKDQQFLDWKEGVRDFYAENTCTGLTWESKNNMALGSLALNFSGKQLFQEMIKTGAKKALKIASKKLFLENLWI